MFSNLLSFKDNNKLTQWKLLHDKPLFIQGYDGCGKSYIAKQLLKDYHIITISSEFIKYSSDIIEHLNSTLFKKDIFMMLSSSNHYKALVIDDIQLFSKYDKSTLSKLEAFVKLIKFSQNPVILLCNECEDKYIKSMKHFSYVITIQFNFNYYKDILNKNILNKNITDSDLHSILYKTKNLNTLLSTVQNFTNSSIDKVDTTDNIINDCLLHTYSYNDIIRKCSANYSTISLNLVENIPIICPTVSKSQLYNIYKSLCIDDYIEYKYILCNPELDIRVFFSCLYPFIHIKQSPIIIKPIKYNTYISRSIIQIHNQSILKDKTVIYLRVLLYIYQNITDYNDTSILHISRYIKEHLINLKILEKQIKVFNYYYNKQMTKKHFTKIMKQISQLVIS